MMFAQIAQIPIQLLDPLLVRLDPLALQPLVQLHPTTHQHSLPSLTRRTAPPSSNLQDGKKRTLFRRFSSWRRSAAVFDTCVASSPIASAFVSWSGWTPRSFGGVGAFVGASVGWAGVDVLVSGRVAGEEGGLGFFFFVFFLVMAPSLVPFRRRRPLLGGGW